MSMHREQPSPLLPFDESPQPEVIEQLSEKPPVPTAHAQDAEEIADRQRVKDFYVRQINLRLHHAPFRIADIQNYPPLRPETILVVEPAAESSLDGAPSYRGRYTLVNARGVLDVQPEQTGGPKKSADSIGSFSKKSLENVLQTLFREMSSEK